MCLWRKKPFVVFWEKKRKEKKSEMDKTNEFMKCLKQQTTRPSTKPTSLERPQTTTSSIAPFVHAATEIAQDIHRIHTTTNTTKTTPESLLRQCSDNVNALEQLVGSLVATTTKTKTNVTRDMKAHMRAIIAILFTRIEETAETLKTKRIALLERERARSTRYSQTTTTTQKQKQKQKETTTTEKEEEEEEKTFTEENAMMVKRMAAHSDDALRGIERQITEIAEMQRIVATKALEQAEDIDTLHEQARRSVATIAESNEALARASRRKRGIWWLLDCNTLTVLSLFSMGFSLLFLNWLHS